MNALIHTAAAANNNDDNDELMVDVTAAEEIAFDTATATGILEEMRTNEDYVADLLQELLNEAKSTCDMDEMLNLFNTMTGTVNETTNLHNDLFDVIDMDDADFDFVVDDAFEVVSRIKSMIVEVDTIFELVEQVNLIDYDEPPFFGSRVDLPGGGFGYVVYVEQCLEEHHYFVRHGDEVITKFTPYEMMVLNEAGQVCNIFLAQNCFCLIN